MEKYRFTGSQIIAILKQSEAGRPVAALWRELSIGTAAFQSWRSKYGGMDASQMKRMKELEEKKHRL